jgi:hypothetical protein
MCEFTMFQLDGAVAIDDQTPDGFLETTLARYKQIASERTTVHQKQHGAVTRCLNTNGEATIVGHGRVGIICTGSGKFLNEDRTERIDHKNIGDWRPSNMTRLTLLGCNTGEGNKGVELVYNIAVATGATVRAPWGYVYIGNDCPDLYLERNTDYIVATPTVKPSPVFDSRPERFDVDVLMLRSGGIFVPVDPGLVTSIALFGPGDFGPKIREWTAPGLIPFDRVEFDKPLLRGHPAAIETGRLVVDVSRVDVTPSKRTFCIYNDNSVQDMTHPQVLYRANIEVLRALPV